MDKQITPQQPQYKKTKKRIMLEIITILLAIVLFLVISSDLCLIKRLTGLPCPACGTTRAYLHLFKGETRLAFFYQPLFLLPVIIVSMLVIQHYNIKLKRNKIFDVFYYIFIISYFVTYIIRMIMYFPHTPPMDYEYNSLLGLIIKAFS